MLLKPAAASSALARPDPAIRLYVLAGPDEAGSRALVDSFAQAMGADAERVDLSQRSIRDNPAALGDETAAFGLFGGKRWVLVTLSSGSGDEWLSAAEAVLDAELSGNPAIIIGGGMTAKSKLVKLAEKHPAAIATVSYLPEGAEAERVAVAIAEPLGLTLSRDVARALVAATGGDRGLMAREAEKLALFLDAAAGQARRAEQSDWLAIGADTPEEDVGAAVNIVLEGRVADLPALFAELVALGTSEIRLVRALAIRALLLARLRGRIDGERMSAAAAIEGERSIFWKEKPAVQRQLSRWSAAALARLIDRLHTLERALKAPDNAGILLLRDELLWISRAAAKAR
jgi:DNA polymerase III subunit delta